MWANLLTRTFKGTPYCSPTDTEVAKASISPEMTLPSLFMVMNISPGTPSS